MSTETEAPNYMLPLALIACTIAVLLGSQVGSSKQSTRIMKWQSETLQKQICKHFEGDARVEATSLPEFALEPDKLRVRLRDTLAKLHADQAKLDVLVAQFIELKFPTKLLTRLEKEYAAQQQQ